MRTKNAQAGNEIVLYATIAAVLLMVLVGIVVIYKKSMEDSAPRQICKQSVAANMLSHIRIEGYELFSDIGEKVNIECSTRYVSVPAGEEFAVTADEMYHCYDQFGQGKWEIFNTESGNFCVVCSQLDYDNKARFVSFTPYLAHETINDISSTTYLEFLAGSDENFDIMNAYDSQQGYGNDYFDTSEPLSVVFVLEKQVINSAGSGSGYGAGVGALAGGAVVIASFIPTTWPFIIGGAVVGAGSGGVAGYVIGSKHNEADYNAYTLVVPASKLTDLKCTRLEGRASGLEVVKV